MFERVEIENFKCFEGPTKFALKSGLNCVIGKNNAGKSSLLEALSLAFSNKPYTSQRVDQVRRPDGNHSTVSFRLIVDRTHLVDFVRSEAAQRTTIAFPTPSGTSALGSQLATHGSQAGNVLLNQLREATSIILTGRRRGNGEVRLHEFEIDGLVGTLSEISGAGTETAQLRLADNGQLYHHDKGSCAVGDDVLSHYISNSFAPRVHYYPAHRTPQACKVGSRRVLNSDFSNVAEVLEQLQADADQFKIFESLVRGVFPEVSSITAQKVSDDQVTIGALFQDGNGSARRPDLRRRFDDFGTGLSFVAGFFSAVLLAQDPEIFLVDEPQCFLHPDALNRFLRKVRDFREHQFVFATHSPAVLAAADGAVLRVVREDSVATVTCCEAKSLSTTRAALTDIGLRLSDVLGFDAIVWVEGPTEADLFPALVDASINDNVEFIPLLHTGDVKGRVGPVVGHIYSRLPTVGLLGSLGIGFFLDSEHRDEITVVGEQIGFTSRLMFESFLIHADALAYLINGLVAEGRGTVTATTVMAKLEEWDPDSVVANEISADWLSKCHGASVIKRLLWELARTEFDKRKHGGCLVRWLRGHQPNHLRPLADEVAGFVKGLTRG